MFIQYDLQQPRPLSNPCPVTDEWIKKLWDTDIMKYCSTMRKHEILHIAAIQNVLEDVRLSTVSQEINNTRYLAHMWKMKKQ